MKPLCLIAALVVAIVMLPLLGGAFVRPAAPAIVGPAHIVTTAEARPASAETDDPFLADQARALGTALLWCREQRMREVCALRGPRSQDCQTAEMYFDALGGTIATIRERRLGRAEQIATLADARDRCLGVGHEPELARATGIHLSTLGGSR